MSVVNCHRSYKLFRTLPLVSLQKLESASVWFLSWVSFIGYRFDGRSRSRQQFWHTSVNLVRLQSCPTHGQLCAAPRNLESYCKSTSTCTRRGHLRSAQTRQLVVSRTRTKYGAGSFAVQGPRIWNSVPAELRAPDISHAVFRNKLKTYLFDIA